MTDIEERIRVRAYYLALSGTLHDACYARLVTDPVQIWLAAERIERGAFAKRSAAAKKAAATRKGTR